jgi:sodium/bile acid cotransporter 7
VKTEAYMVRCIMVLPASFSCVSLPAPHHPALLQRLLLQVPYELRLVLSTGSVNTVSVEPGSLVVKLLLTVLVPSVLGKLARDLFKPVQRFVTRYKTQLSLFSTLNLACIVWQTLSGARQTLLQQPFVAVLLVVVASSVLHLVMLAFNGLVVRYLLRLPFREAVAVLIMASQKSAPVAVSGSNCDSMCTRHVPPATAGELSQHYCAQAVVSRSFWSSAFQLARGIATTLHHALVLHWAAYRLIPLHAQKA